LHMAQLMLLLLTVSCFSKIQISFCLYGTGSPRVVPDNGPLNGCVCGGGVPADPGNLRQRAVKNVCVCVHACVRVCV